MNGAILLYGITRGNGKRVAKALDRTIYKLLKSAGHKLTVFQHTWEIDTIYNPRSKVNEHGVKVKNRTDWKHFQANKKIIQDQSKFDSTVDWDNVFAGCNISFAGGHSLDNLKNMYRQMNSLERVYKLVNGTYDYYFILRQDLLYVDTNGDKMLESIDTLSGTSTPVINVPEWGAPKGVNDRMAICNRKGAEIYCNRWRYIDTCPQNVSSEIYLDHVIHHTSARSTKFRQIGKRLRANGEIEKFDLRLK